MTDFCQRSRFGRRGFLAAAGGMLLAPTVGGRANAQGGAPNVEWTQEYVDESGEILGLQVTAASDGGFILAGRTGDIEFPKTGVVKTDSAGERVWTTEVDDGNDLTRQQPFAVVETSDGDYVVVGYGGYGEEPGDYRDHAAVAQAARLDADGEVRWTREFDAFEEDDEGTTEPDPIPEDSAMFLDAVATDDDGVVAGGYRDGDPWAVKLDATGDLVWEQSNTERSYFQQVLRDANGGFALIGRPRDDDPYLAVHLTPDGDVRRRTSLEIDYDEIGIGHQFTTTRDGGYAYCGHNWFGADMALAKLGADGTGQWLRTYDGPASGSDRAAFVIETDDGGFLIAGNMETQAEGRPRPAVVKTDAQGTERWRHVLYEPTNIEGDTGYARVVEAADGGFAALARPWLVRFGASGGDGETPQPTPGGTPTDTETPTDNRTPTDTPTETTDDGAGFGALAGLGGLLAVGWFRFRDDSE